MTDRVLLETVEEDELVGGIHIPTHFNRQNPPRGIVRATGPKVTTVSGGEVVFYHQIGNVFPFGDEKYTLVREVDLVAIIEGTDSDNQENQKKDPS